VTQIIAKTRPRPAVVTRRLSGVPPPHRPRANGPRYSRDAFRRLTHRIGAIHAVDVDQRAGEPPPPPHDCDVSGA